MAVYMEGLVRKLNSTYYLQGNFKDSHVAVASITILLTFLPLTSKSCVGARIAS